MPILYVTWGKTHSQTRQGSATMAPFRISLDFVTCLLEQLSPIEFIGLLKHREEAGAQLSHFSLNAR